MSARVLVIEDNRTNLELMSYLLGAFGHTILAAENGEKGLETVHRRRPELIVCDVQLPDIDGFEIARRLKSDPEFRSIPLVAVTTPTSFHSRSRASQKSSWKSAGRKSAAIQRDI